MRRWLSLWLPLFLIASPAIAVEFSLEGAQGELLWRDEAEISIPTDAGHLTLHFLERAQREGAISGYEGDAESIASIHGLGNEARPVSADEIEFFGWCYTVDGKAPAAYPADVKITDQATRIEWFYAFALLRGKEWVAECVPATESRAPRL